MNTTAAYLVAHQHPGIELTQTLFTHSTLLTARKAAMSYVEDLLAQLWKRGDLLTIIEVQLIESTTQPLAVDRPAIARVYRLVLPINPQPCYLQSKEDFYQALAHLHEEFLYYQGNGHPTGFGFFTGEFEDGDERQLYTHLYEACGYVSQLTGAYEAYRQALTLPSLQTYLTYDDNHAVASAQFAQ